MTHKTDHTTLEFVLRDGGISVLRDDSEYTLRSDERLSKERGMELHRVEQSDPRGWFTRQQPLRGGE